MFQMSGLGCGWSGLMVGARARRGQELELKSQSCSLEPRNRARDRSQSWCKLGQSKKSGWELSRIHLELGWKQCRSRAGTEAIIAAGRGIELPANYCWP